MNLHKEVLKPIALKRPTLSCLNPKEQKLFNSIFDAFIYSGYPLEHYKEIPRTFFYKQFGTYYYKLKKSLIEKKVLEVSSKEYVFRDENTTHKAKNKCLSYRINPLVFGGNVRKEVNLYKVKPKPTNRLLKWTYSNLKSIDIAIPKDKWQCEVVKFVNLEYVKKRYIHIDLLSSGLYYFAYFDYKKSEVPITLEAIKKQVKDKKLEALFCKKKRIIIIGKIDKIYSQKIDVLRSTYFALLDNFDKDSVKFISRSKTNNRLTTPFTVFPSDLMKYLTIDQEPIKNIDISNSQFCILSNLIQAQYDYNNNKEVSLITTQFKKEKVYFKVFQRSFNLLLNNEGKFKEDVQSFLDIATNGQLYETIQEEATLTRKEAKEGMFIIGFSDYRNNPPLKQKIKTIYPNVIKFMDMVKKELPKRDKVHLAVLLQKIESFICIDHILQTLKEHKIKALTRHDSFCIGNSQASLTEIIVRGQLRHLLPYGFSLKIN